MERLILLLISIVMTGILIYAIPLGFSRREKNIIVLTSSLLGSFGLISVSIVAFWQVLVLMVLLGTSAGYIIVNRTASKKAQVPLIERLHNSHEEVSLGSGPVKELEDSIEFPLIDNLPILNPENSYVDEPLITIEDDISFLDERNKLHLTSSEWEQPVTNRDSSDFQDEIWLEESAEEKVYASTQS